MKTLALIAILLSGCANIESEPSDSPCGFVGETRWCMCPDGYRGQQWCPTDTGTRRTVCDCSEDRAGLLDRRLNPDAGRD